MVGDPSTKASYLIPIREAHNKWNVFTYNIALSRALAAISSEQTNDDSATTETREKDTTEQTSHDRNTSKATATTEDICSLYEEITFITQITTGLAEITFMLLAKKPCPRGNQK